MLSFESYFNIILVTKPKWYVLKDIGGISVKRKKIIFLRVEKNLNQEQMGKMLGVTSQYISFIECGRSNGSYKFWENFKRVFNISNEEIESYKELTN